MATLYSSLKALLAKNETIHLPEVFNKLGIDNQQQGEDLFKAAVENLVKLPYGKNAKTWARTIKGNGYAVLRTEEVKQYWIEQAMKQASAARLIQFYEDEATAVTRKNKRQKVKASDIGSSSGREDEINDDGIKAEDDDGIDDGGIEAEDDEDKDDHSEQALEQEIIQTWSDFMTKTNFVSSHYYRLERHGIVQCGNLIKKPDDVPEHLYDQITLENEADPFPFVTFATYFKKTLLSESYGTTDCASLIFDKSNVEGPFDNTAFDFLARVLYTLSEQVHNKLLPSPLMESEMTYAHSALWPLLQTSTRAIPGLVCDFKFGETLLKALDSNGVPSYKADGIVFQKRNGLELLILEASGAYGTRNRHRHVFDHIKGAFGCHAMIRSILTKYPGADASLLENVSVCFVHASAKGVYICTYRKQQ
ncbi:unnamed protein product [Absidia cylindrospora]